jgi:hypothetical protein
MHRVDTVQSIGPDWRGLPAVGVDGVGDDDEELLMLMAAMVEG